MTYNYKKSLYESIIIDIAKVVKSKLNEDLVIDIPEDEESSSELLARKTREKEEEIREAVTGLMKSMENIKTMIEDIDDLDDQKFIFFPELELELTNNDEEDNKYNLCLERNHMMSSKLIDITEEHIDELCDYIFENYNKKITYGYFIWRFYFLESEDLLNKFVDFGSLLEKKYKNSNSITIDMEGDDSLNYIEFKNYRPLELLKVMKKWIDKIYIQFIIIKLNSEAIYNK